jgi:hypothetical protein
LSNLGVQLLDLAFARFLALPPDTRVKGPGRLFQQLLLPRINLVRRCARSATVACSRTASSAIFAFNATSIFRLIFFVIMPSVYQTERPFSNLASGPKIGVHFISRPEVSQ